MKTFKSFQNLGGVVHGVFDKCDVPEGAHSRAWYRYEFPQFCVKKLGFEKFAFPKQEHTANVMIVDQEISFEDSPIADAFVTKTPGLMVGVRTADCGPILFADPINKVIGACHAGWKGAVHGVVANTIQTMLQVGAKIEFIVSGVGPMISQESYEVGQEIYDETVQIDSGYSQFLKFHKEGKWLFDIRGLILFQLKEIGMDKIEVMHVNTYSHPDCFSYRRATHLFPNLPVKERLNGKRKWSLIGLKEE
ncbi:MAG: peptidoglycan editing factor PgeF [Alphaproteobacteria bacterium]|nr:peptidoglycan editing factor PgeF [Alphaproteobacteria bacterium]